MKIAMMAALIRPEMGTVTNQATKMFRNRRQSTAFLERSHPTATTEPTCKHSRCQTNPTSFQNVQTSNYITKTLLHIWTVCQTFSVGENRAHKRSLPVTQTTGFDHLTLQWVVETGRPMFDATTTVTAEASSMLKPLTGNKTTLKSLT